ncbi:MAG: hypothetical protein KC517_11010 [Bacteroidetes bacterium]|nr:hypothetical protein [Bacteroidota bacterium]
MQRLLAFTLISFVLYSYGVNAEEPVLKVEQDQLKANMAKLDSQIQELNTSLEEGTEKIRQEQFERSMRNNQRTLERLVAKRKEEQKKRDRWNLFRGLLLVVTVIAAIVGRTAKKKSEKAQQELDSSEIDNQSE